MELGVNVTPCTRPVACAQARPNHSMEGKVGTKLRNFWQFIAARRGRVSYFNDVAPVKLTRLQWMAMYPRIYVQHRLDLMDDF